MTNERITRSLGVWLAGVDSTLVPSTLSGTDMLRVSAANVLYEFTAEVMDLCTLLGKACMVENPRNSLFWVTTWWAECDSNGHHHISDHQACAYGAQRPKWTRLTANFEQVHTICNTCPGDHTHLPWESYEVATNEFLQHPWKCTTRNSSAKLLPMLLF